MRVPRYEHIKQGRSGQGVRAMTDAAEVAGEILRWHAQRERFEPFAARFGITEVGAAYDVQDIVVRHRCEERAARPVGYKIGLTSPRMQQMCGIDSPIAGVVLGTEVHRSGASVPLSRFVRLGIEFELAVRIGRDVEPGSLPKTTADVASVVDAICPAIELVEDRNADYSGGLDALSLVADNSWNGGIVLGEFRTDFPEPGDIPAAVALNGETIDHGNSRDALGHPYAPVAWLAEHLASRGQMLRRGDVVMTGSIVPTRFPKAGERYRLTLDGVGSVDLVLAD
jgi:2-keto-4-pentenoate hydratase